MALLFIIKMTPHRAIATMLVHLPAGPVMVFTTFSRGLENSVMPPEAAAISGRQRLRLKRARHMSAAFLPGHADGEALPLGGRCFALMTVSVEAVMRRWVGAVSPQV